MGMKNANNQMNLGRNMRYTLCRAVIVIQRGDFCCGGAIIPPTATGRHLLRMIAATCTKFNRLFYKCNCLREM